MTLIDLLAPTYLQMLNALSAWLQKAEQQLPPEQTQALLISRLAPDMFPLATQVRFACVQALEGVHRLHGMAFPPLHAAMLEEGRNAAERPGSVSDAIARIEETIAAVAALSEKSGSGQSAPIAHDLPNGMVFDLTAEQYSRDWALGQFYFHLMIAYAVLRNQGIALGKADYVAHMFAHIRPGTIPAG
ncbi:MAG: DUF1993 family protein [Novosphingobium sp.]